MIEVKGQIVQDSIVWHNAHVMRPTRSGKFNWFIMCHLPVAVDNPVIHIGERLSKVEEHQFASGCINLEMRTDAKGFDEFAPLLNTICFQCIHINFIWLAAL